MQTFDTLMSLVLMSLWLIVVLVVVLVVVVVVCCLLFVVCCLLFAVCCLPFVVCWLLVGGWLLVVGCWLLLLLLLMLLLLLLLSLLIVVLVVVVLVLVGSKGCIFPNLGWVFVSGSTRSTIWSTRDGTTSFKDFERKVGGPKREVSRLEKLHGFRDNTVSPTFVAAHQLRYTRNL